jgi:hypothetical protein
VHAPAEALVCQVASVGAFFVPLTGEREVTPVETSKDRTRSNTLKG